MFGIGIWELLLVAIVGLVILGPERLYSTLSTIKQYFTLSRNILYKLKSELTEQLDTIEIKQDIEKVEDQFCLKQLEPTLTRELNDNYSELTSSKKCYDKKPSTFND